MFSRTGTNILNSAACPLLSPCGLQQSCSILRPVTLLKVYCRPMSYFVVVAQYPPTGSPVKSTGIQDAAISCEWYIEFSYFGMLRHSQPITALNAVSLLIYYLACIFFTHFCHVLQPHNLALVLPLQCSYVVHQWFATSIPWTKILSDNYIAAITMQPTPNTWYTCVHQLLRRYHI